MNVNGADAPKKPDIDRKPPLRRPARRWPYVIVIVTLVCLILCIVLAVLFGRKSKSDCPEGIHCDWHSMPSSQFLKDERCDQICTTYPCIKSAHYALSRIDANKDPCDDFYEFACGAYEKQSILLPEDNEGAFAYKEMENEMFLNMKEIIDSVAEKPGKKGYALRLAKRVYDDCMNTDHHRDVLTKDIWKKIFSGDGLLPWALIDKNSHNNEESLVKLMSSSLLYNVNPFFWTRGPVEETVKNKSVWVFQFRQVDLKTLQSIHKEADVDDTESSFSRYLFVMGKILTEVGVNPNALRNILPSIVELEKAFLEAATKVVKSNEKIYKTNEHLMFDYHDHSCQELDHRMSHLKWCKIGRQLLLALGLTPKSGIRINLPSIIDYYEEVNKVFGHFLDRDIINYIGLKFIMGHLEYMPSPLREMYYREKDLFPSTGKHWTLSSRWQQCIEIVGNFLLPPIEREYLKQKVDEETIAKVRFMVKKTKETLSSLIGKISWLSFLSSDKVIEELNLYIGRLDTILSDDGSATDRYLENAASNSVLQNARNPLMADVIELKRLIAKTPPEKEIGTLQGRGHFRVHTVHGISAREIEVPYGMLMFPMFLPGRPMYAEYATFGSYIFNYMTNLLLIEGPMDNATFQITKKAAYCLREQIHLQKTGKIKFKVDSDEDIRAYKEFLIAVGTHGSFQAYMNYVEDYGEEKGLPGLPFSNKQLFFISNAQFHCEKFTEKGYADFPRPLTSPARFRVNVPLANSNAFSEAFRCPSGSPMNPKRKCCLLGDGKLSHQCK